MFEDKYVKLPSEPPMTNLESDIIPMANAGRNNGSIPSSARKRNRSPSKNNSDLGWSGQHSSMITSWDGGESGVKRLGEIMQTNDENTLRQLCALQDQVKPAI